MKFPFVGKKQLRLKNTDIADRVSEAPQKPISCELKLGMRRREIYNILHDRVSGETTQEVVNFFTYGIEDSAQQHIDFIKKHIPEFKKDDLEVISSNNECAIIKKDVITAWRNSLNTASDYYICGINDEGDYFVHPLHNAPVKTTVEEVLDWINRKDQGFTERLQGDIVMQFVSYDKTDKDQYTMEGIWNESQIFNVRNKDRAVKSTDIHTLGRHRIVVNGFVNTITKYKEPDTYTLVEADEIAVVHPEHKVTKRTIPENHFVILANQRGRKRDPEYHFD